MTIHNAVTMWQENREGAGSPTMENLTTVNAT